MRFLTRNSQDTLFRAQARDRDRLIGTRIYLAKLATFVSIPCRLFKLKRARSDYICH